jgi:hypothetical protein
MAAHTGRGSSAKTGISASAANGPRTPKPVNPAHRRAVRGGRLDTVRPTPASTRTKNVACAATRIPVRDSGAFHPRASIQRQVVIASPNAAASACRVFVDAPLPASLDRQPPDVENRPGQESQAGEPESANEFRRARPVVDAGNNQARIQEAAQVPDQQRAAEQDARASLVQKAPGGSHELDEENRNAEAGQAPDHLANQERIRNLVQFIHQ